jgi:8-oxo-dGTP pyrophosphatase MutT (NUDIX family)
MLKFNRFIQICSYSTRADAVKNNLIEKFSKLNTGNHYEYLVSKNSKIGQFKRASVLVPISVDDNGKTYFTFMQRTGTRHYSGQMCFMGGMADADDRDEIETAFREAREESGIDKSRFTLLSSLCPLVVTNVGRDSFVLTPVVVYFDKHSPGLEVNLNKTEVDRLVDVETERFLKNEHYEPNPINIVGDEFYFHYFEKIKLADDEVISIFGITAMISTIVSSFWHSKAPEFQVDPELKFNPNEPNQFLYDFAIHRLPNVIDLLLNQK